MRKRFEPVFLVDKDDLRTPLFGFLLAHRYEGRDDDLVPWLYLPGSRSIERNYSASRVRGECVGGEPFTRRNAPNTAFLEGENAGRLHQRGVYLDASLIVEVGTRDSRPVNLAL